MGAPLFSRLASGNHQTPPGNLITTMDGTFVLSSNENYDAFLKAVGIPDELAAKMLAAKPTVEIKGSGGGGITMTIKAGDKSFTNTVTWGVDSPQELAGLKYTVNVKPLADGSGHAGTIVTPGGKSGTIEVKKTADGYCQCITLGGVSCKRNYKKA